MNNLKVKFKVLIPNPAYDSIGRTPTVAAKLEEIKEGTIQGYMVVISSNGMTENSAVVQVKNKLEVVKISDLEILE